MIRKRLSVLALLGAFLGLSLASNAQADEHKHDAPIIEHAVCVLMPTKGNKVRGRVYFTQTKSGVALRGRVNNLTPGKHGFHIHEFGDLTDRTGKSAGGHYNPEGHPHSGPDSEKRHVGDLGNIVANDDGVAAIDMTVEGLKLHFVLGRSIVVHGGEDDLESQPSGAAGPRVAVGVIGVSTAPERPKKKK